jgi:putative transposase
MANLASRCAKGNWPMIATLVRSVFEQPDRDTTWGHLADVTDQLTQAGFVDVVTYLLDAADDILAFSAFPTEHWGLIRSNNPQKRLNKEIRRRTDVVGMFPNRGAVIRLVGARLAEQTDEWAITRRYMSADSTQSPTETRALPRGPEGGHDAAGEEAEGDSRT